jgi:chemotaxis protein MotB
MAKNEEAGRYKRQQNELSQANRDLEEQIKTLSAEISRGKAQAQQLTTERTKLTGQLKQIKAGANELASAREKAERAVQIQQQLINSLKEEIAAGQVKITQLTGRTAIRLEEKILFYSGHASIKPSGLAVLNKIGKTLEKIRDRHIQVEGHTDTVPIRWEFKEKYPTNWELSTARATSIVRYLIDEVGIKPTRLSAAGYSFYRPVASNDSPEGRQENRRVEFALLPIS